MKQGRYGPFQTNVKPPKIHLSPTLRSSGDPSIIMYSVGISQSATRIRTPWLALVF